MPTRSDRWPFMILRAGAAALLFCGPLFASAQTPAAIGLVVTREIFQPVDLVRNFYNDKLRDALELPDSGPVSAFDVDLNGDDLPERLLIGAEKLCGTGGCPYTLLDGKTQKEIGSFFGTLVVLDRKVGQWRVVQTIGRDEDGLRALNTYTFQRVQYQADDATMIDADAYELLLISLRSK